jgi:hypothetical protein
MATLANHVTLSPEQARIVREELSRILDSDFFRSSDKCCRFLRYITEKLLEGCPPEALKERVIGTEVFHRSVDYDTAQDNVVRVTATEVRKRLAQYYRDPGASEDSVFTLHPGSYAISLQGKSFETDFPLQTHLTTIEDVKDANLKIEASPARRTYRILVWSVGLLVAVAVLSSTAFFGAKSRSHEDAQREIWSPLLNDPKPVLICIAQPYAFARTSADGLVPANDYFVGVGDAQALADTSRFLSTRGKPWRLLAGHETPSADLQAGPLILIGSFSNPWTLQITEDLPFVFENGTDKIIRDRRGTGRIWKIGSGIPDLKPAEDYAIVARFLSAKTGEQIIVIAGITNFGTQAAGEFIVSPEMLRNAFANAPHGRKDQNFEFVLHTKVIGSSPERPTVVASYFW